MIHAICGEPLVILLRTPCLHHPDLHLLLRSLAKPSSTSDVPDVHLAAVIRRLGLGEGSGGSRAWSKGVRRLSCSTRLVERIALFQQREPFRIITRHRPLPEILGAGEPNPAG